VLRVAPSSVEGRLASPEHLVTVLAHGEPPSDARVLSPSKGRARHSTGVEFQDQDDSSGSALWAKAPEAESVQPRQRRSGRL